MYVYMHAYINTYINTYRHTYMHTFACIWICVDMYIHMSPVQVDRKVTTDYTATDDYPTRAFGHGKSYTQLCVDEKGMTLLVLLSCDAPVMS